MEEETKEVVNQQNTQAPAGEVNPIEQDKAIYAELEQFITDKKFTYVIACKQYGNQNVTSLIANKEFKMTPQFKFFIQATIIDVLNSIGKDLINEFSQKGLTIGESKHFITPEKLTDIIGKHLEDLEKEGKIKITPINQEAKEEFKEDTAENHGEIPSVPAN